MGEVKELIKVEIAGNGLATVTLNRPKSMNSLSQAMIEYLAEIFKSLGQDQKVKVIILTGAGRGFCAGVDLNAAKSVFQKEIHAIEKDPIVMMGRCKQPIIGAVNGYAITAGFEIALACDILIASTDAKFMDTHAKVASLNLPVNHHRKGTIRDKLPGVVRIYDSFKDLMARSAGFVCLKAVDENHEDELINGLCKGNIIANLQNADVNTPEEKWFGIFPSWGLSQKLSRLIGVNRARHASLSAMPIDGETAERWGLVSQVVPPTELIKAARVLADAILGNNEKMVQDYKAIINDGAKLPLGEALQIEQERAHAAYKAMTPEDFEKMQKFISGRRIPKQSPSKL